jgi:polysaccharide export outer membrane protein
LAGGIVMSTAITGSMPGGDKVILKGTRDGKLFIKEITLSSIYLDKNVDDDVIIMPRDEIYVPFLMFFIYGEVQRAGSYPVFSEMTVMQALAQGGGLTPRGTQRNITLFRRDKSTGIVEKTHPLMTDVIQQNDVILVPESLF